MGLAEHRGLGVDKATARRDTPKMIEDAAQDRLTAHYRERGWTVTDTRLANPYDAITSKDGQVVYLELRGRSLMARQCG